MQQPKKVKKPMSAGFRNLLNMSVRTLILVAVSLLVLILVVGLTVSIWAHTDVVPGSVNSLNSTQSFQVVSDVKATMHFRSDEAFILIVKKDRTPIEEFGDVYRDDGLGYRLNATLGKGEYTFVGNEGLSFSVDAKDGVRVTQDQNIFIGFVLEMTVALVFGFIWYWVFGWVGNYTPFLTPPLEA